MGRCIAGAKKLSRVMRGQAAGAKVLEFGS